MMLTCGDALIDFVPVKAADGRDAYVTAVGGSCLNVAVAMARLDAPTALIAGISNDMFGSMIVTHATRSRVDLRFATRSDDETTLAFVRFVDGEPHYAFYDEASASRRWTYRPGAVPFEQAHVLHVGSTTLINEPTSSQTLSLVEEARQATTISFDPNCRPGLVRDRAAYAARMAEFAARADVIRMSDMDFDFLYGGNDYRRGAETLLAGGASLVVITRGAAGASAWHRSGCGAEVASPGIRVVDTIGAGDTFQGALLVALLELGYLARDRLRLLTEEALHQALTFAVTSASITCSRAGADPPDRREVRALMEQ